MRALVADKIPPQGRDGLSALGFDVVFAPDTTADDLPTAMAEHDPTVLVVRSTKVREAAIESGTQLSLIVRAGAGVNTIDLAAASRRGVFVANCPGKNAIAVAELAMALLLAVDRQLVAANRDLHAGTWNKKKYGTGRGLFGRTLGLVGFGAIARAVAARARAFGMDVVAYSRTLDDATAKAHGVRRATGLDDMLGEVDALSIHVPLTDETHHLFDEARLRRLRRGTIVVHTARGGVVDDASLAKLVAEGHLRAGLDVFESEPGSGSAPFDSPLRGLEGVVGTPHIGASTEQAEVATAEEMVRVVRTYLETGTPANAVNIVRDRPARWTVVVRHRDRVGVLAGVLGALREADLNVQEMQNIVFAGDEAACATITLEREPPRALLDELAASPDVFAVDLRRVVE
ncbi:MAG: hydroxyacid dehydrogenase [Deltaproteobacteria bacterium]|nr:MAG: hydroxyacid dehydrogenase [Deltaproteobacteria bacterium]